MRQVCSPLLVLFSFKADVQGSRSWFLFSPKDSCTSCSVGHGIIEHMGFGVETCPYLFSLVNVFPQTSWRMPEAAKTRGRVLGQKRDGHEL